MFSLIASMIWKLRQVFFDFACIFGQEFLDVSKDGIGFDNVSSKGNVRCAYDVVV